MFVYSDVQDIVFISLK